MPYTRRSLKSRPVHHFLQKKPRGHLNILSLKAPCPFLASLPPTTSRRDELVLLLLMRSLLLLWWVLISYLVASQLLTFFQALNTHWESENILEKDSLKEDEVGRGGSGEEKAERGVARRAGAAALEEESSACQLLGSGPAHLSPLLPWLLPALIPCPPRPLAVVSLPAPRL